MKKQFVIGIDPGVKTGFAMYDRGSRTIVMTETLTFWAAYFKMSGLTAMAADLIVAIEVPKHTRLHEYQDGKTGARLREKIAGNVGGIAREAELLADGLELLGFEVRRVVPSRSKWTAKDLEQRTRITARTNEHVRDAISLCFGL